ncbi:hypothetical protein VTK26DRAFT_3593 [Humicola hyalothermophila]
MQSRLIHSIVQLQQRVVRACCQNNTSLPDTANAPLPHPKTPSAMTKKRGQTRRMPKGLCCLSRTESSPDRSNIIINNKNNQPASNPPPTKGPWQLPAQLFYPPTPHQNRKQLPQQPPTFAFPFRCPLHHRLWMRRDIVSRDIWNQRRKKIEEQKSFKTAVSSDPGRPFNNAVPN